MKYAVVVPAHNEEKFIEFTLKSVCNQTILPVKAIIVDDGSTDKTRDIALEYSKIHSWIEVIPNNNASTLRQGGQKVVRAFYAGYNIIDKSSFDFIVKLDADLSLPSDYFEKLGITFNDNPEIGLCGGIILNKMADGRLVKETYASYHVRGAFKCYRKKCFEEIGGFPLVYNWDGLDEMKAMYLGWQIKVLPLEVIHHRPTSTLINRGLKSFYKAGDEYYRDGNSLFLALLQTVIKSMRGSPKILCSLWFIAGFLKSFFYRSKKNVDPEIQRFIRTFQYRRIYNTLFMAKN